MNLDNYMYMYKFISTHMYTCTCICTKYRVFLTCGNDLIFD